MAVSILSSTSHNVNHRAAPILIRVWSNPSGLIPMNPKWDFCKLLNFHYHFLYPLNVYGYSIWPKSKSRRNICNSTSHRLIILICSYYWERKWSVIQYFFCIILSTTKYNTSLQGWLQKVQIWSNTLYILNQGGC